MLMSTIMALRCDSTPATPMPKSNAPTIRKGTRPGPLMSDLLVGVDFVCSTEPFPRLVTIAFHTWDSFPVVFDVSQGASGKCISAARLQLCRKYSPQRFPGLLAVLSLVAYCRVHVSRKEPRPRYLLE